MKNNKTFRLFISSTFNDFREERKMLQTKVFPEIKEYCREKGYHFQPIDLRWGINEEAQLDQKTLEVCLEEVKTCKAYPYPNFLVMLGDRYGWIPLPYAIEKKEFEEVVKFVDNRELLLNWYQLDNNQLPPSYILKHREGRFKNANIWNKTEETLLLILQKAVDKSSLTKEQKRKYFTSATEAEIKEGILTYLSLTDYQEKLLLEKPELIENDSEHIFSFIRNINKSHIISDKFVSNDYQKAQELKSKVKSLLLKENIYECDTIQKNEKELDYSYLDILKKKIIKFLKDKIDNQIDKETLYTELEIEKQEQEYFAKQKRKNFTGQESLLKKIDDYISGDNRQAFILYGKSGSGKSSIMAKAIEKSKQNSNSITIFRFVGATANSSSSYSLLTSILNELKINVNNENLIKRELLNSKENFEEFSERVKNELLNLKTNVVLFIDAVDQLINIDNFLWLPITLPKNIKIIISALKDEKYQSESVFFKSIIWRTKNIFKVDDFDKPRKLLFDLLKNEHRTIQNHQFEYFLNKYNKVKTPLYVYVATQEIKNWKSFDLTKDQVSQKGVRTRELANSQKGIISKFIENLVDLSYHDKSLVEKVISYIYASKDGLSENEIIELLNTDKHFIKKIAPDTWHKNINQKLPLVIWTRLYTQLKPFLSKKNQDNEELLFFFHREFIEVIKNNNNLKKEHSKLIKATQVLIDLNIEKEFTSNRYGILFSKSFSLYIDLYRKKSNEDNYILPTYKIEWIKYFINAIFENVENKKHYFLNLIDWNNSQHINHTDVGITYLEINYLIFRHLYKNDENEVFSKLYINSLLNFAFALREIGENKKTTYFFRKIYLLKKEKYNNDKSKFDEYILSYINYASNYKRLNLEKGIKLEKKILNIINKQKILNDNIKYRKVLILNNLSHSFHRKNDYDKAIEYGILAKDYYNNSSINDDKLYENILGNITNAYYFQRNYEKVIDVGLVELEFRLKRNYHLELTYNKRFIIDNLLQLSDAYYNINDKKNSIKYLKKSKNILFPFLKINHEKWFDLYSKIIMKLFDIYSIDNFDSAIKILEENSEIFQKLYLSNQKVYFSKLEKEFDFWINDKNKDDTLQKIEKLYYKNSSKWSLVYISYLTILSSHYKSNKKHTRSLFYVKKLEPVLEKQMNINSVFLKHYIDTLLNIIWLYDELKETSKSKKYYDKTIHLIIEQYKKDKKIWETYLLSLFNNLSYYVTILNDEKIITHIKKEYLPILDKLFIENNNKWYKAYIKLLDGILIFYNKINKIAENISISEKLLEVLKTSYQIDDKLFNAYFINLIEISYQYIKIRNIEKFAIVLNNIIDSFNEQFDKKGNFEYNSIKAFLLYIINLKSVARIKTPIYILDRIKTITTNNNKIDSKKWSNLDKSVQDLINIYSKY